MVLLLALNVLELTYDMPAIQPSLRDLGLCETCPGVETPGYFQASLRDDDDEILVALLLEVRCPGWVRTFST